MGASAFGASALGASVFGAFAFGASAGAASDRDLVFVAALRASASAFAAAFVLCGPITMTMLRPSIIGVDSTEPNSETSSANRCKQTHALVGTRLLAAAEQDHCLHLVARSEEALGTLALGFVVVGVDLETEPNLFEDRVRLIASSFLGLLSLFVLELAVIHDLGHGRLGIGSNLNQIQVGLLSQAQSVLDADYAYLLALRANKTHLRNADSVIGTGIADAGLLLVSRVRVSAARRLPQATREDFPLTTGVTNTLTAAGATCIEPTGCNYPVTLRSG